MIIRNNQDISELFFEKGLSELNKEELFLDCGTPEKIDMVVQRTYMAKRIFDEKIQNQNSKTLVFCAPVQNIVYDYGGDQKKINAFHSKVCSAVFNGELKDKIDASVSFNNYLESGQFKNSVYLSSELPYKEQKATIENFKILDKPPFILCTVGMLIEGFDFPDLENLILLRPTLSMRLFEQQVGRITRLKSNKNQGNIFEIIDNIDIDSLYEKFGEKDIFLLSFLLKAEVNPIKESEYVSIYFPESEVNQYKENIIQELLSNSDSSIRNVIMKFLNSMDLQNFIKNTFEGIPGRMQIKIHSFRSNRCYIFYKNIIPERVWNNIKKVINTINTNEIINESLLKMEPSRKEILKKISFLEIFKEKKVLNNERVNISDFKQYENVIEDLKNKGIIKIINNGDIILRGDISTSKFIDREIVVPVLKCLNNL